MFKSRLLLAVSFMVALVVMVFGDCGILLVANDADSSVANKYSKFLDDIRSMC